MLIFKSLMFLWVGGPCALVNLILYSGGDPHLVVPCLLVIAADTLFQLIWPSGSLFMLSGKGLSSVLRRPFSSLWKTPYLPLVSGYLIFMRKRGLSVIFTTTVVFLISHLLLQLPWCLQFTRKTRMKTVFFTWLTVERTPLDPSNSHDTSLCK